MRQECASRWAVRSVLRHTTISDSSTGYVESEDSEMKFSGMTDPEMDVPLIEFETPDGRLIVMALR